MNCKPLFLSVLTASLLISNDLRAQLGWQWGRTNTIAGHQPGVEGFLDAYVITLDKSGNVYAAGSNNYPTNATVYGTDTVPNTNNNYQLVVAKADSNGNFLWAAGTQNCLAMPVAMATDYTGENSGELYLYGYYDSASCTIGSTTITNPSPGSSMYFLTKFSPDGVVMWAKDVVQGEGDWAESGMGVDSAGYVYVTGVFELSSVTIGTTTLTSHGTADIFIAKFDPGGNPVWAKSFGSSTGDAVTSITVTTGGHLYVTGSYGASPFYIGSTSLSDSMKFLAEFDVNGNLLWAKNLNSTMLPTAITTDVYGNIYAVGNVSGSSGSITVVGPDTLVNMNFDNAFVAKYDHQGNPKWAKLAGSRNGNYGFSISLDVSNKLWVTGSMGDSVNLNGNILVEPTGSFDPVFFAEYNTYGTYVNSLALPSGGDDKNELMVDNRGNFYLVEDYCYVPMTIGPDLMPDPSLDTQAEALFIGKYKYANAVIDSSVYLGVRSVTKSSLGIVLTPNPANTTFSIQSDNPFQDNSRAEFYDLTGRLINTYVLYGVSTTITVSGLPPGVYQCKIVSGDVSIVKSLVLME